MTRLLSRAAASLALAAAVACARPPPAQPTAIVEQEPEEPEAPPPPPCESIDEGCVAKGDTRARIAGSGGWTLNVPEGWTYAQQESTTIATSKGSALALTTYESPGTGKKNQKKDAALKDQALTALVEELAVEFPKAKGKKRVTFPRKIDERIAVGAIEVALAQLDGPVRKSMRGSLLAFSAALPEGKVIVGVGFVPDDDLGNADAAILRSIDSIAPGPSAPEEDTP
jgi:hypothetical protein